ncbi:MAG: alpha-glucosidase [Acidimicrobiaceae bacterium]|nr:alpha-glucosidase [Acidimicrobiaceae bacterium]
MPKHVAGKRGTARRRMSGPVASGAGTTKPKEKGPAVERESWWETAVIYQVYVRSFTDGDGDGIGDLAGVRSRLGYLRELGVDAIWFNPWYLSPMADGGYDIVDYHEIEPLFGSIEQAEQLIAEAHALGIRIVLDVVPNHGSDQEPWFGDALTSPSGSPERARYHFRPGRGANGELAPNDWESIFGGPAWTRTNGPEGQPGEWYLHLFAPEQPDYNWDNPEVRAHFDEVLRFWFDRGVDGFRIDSAALLVKEPRLVDLGASDWTRSPGGHPFVDRDGIHDVYRQWRRLADSYTGKRLLVGEVWLPEQPDRFARYLRPDELHAAFNFSLLGCAFEATALREVIETTLDSHVALGPWPTWVLSNHDVVRPVTRYGRCGTAFSMDDRRIGEASDLELGARRARAAALLTLSLPGAVYIYQGEELGLWEVEELPDELLEDPIWRRSGHTDRGRDGCRVPIPWTGQEAPFGFGPDGSTPWLPQPAQWKDFTVEAESADAGSMLELYRAALRLRRLEPAFRTRELRWLPARDGVLVYCRGTDLLVVANLSDQPIDLSRSGEVLLSSAPTQEAKLPVDCAAWLRLPAGRLRSDL